MRSPLCNYYKNLAEKNQNKINRICDAYCSSKTDEEFAEKAYKILMEEDDE